MKRLLKPHYLVIAFLSFQVIAQPSVTAQDADALLHESRERVAGLEVAMEKIARAVTNQPGSETTCFNWDVQNELRHFYSARDPEKSFHHCNVILRNSVMDGYLLSILAEWSNDPETQVKNLLNSAERYPRFAFVSAACALRAAGLTSDAALRQKLLHRVADLSGEGLAPYVAIARTILKARQTGTASN